MDSHVELWIQICSGLVVFIVSSVALYLASEIHKARQSVSTLNENIAVVISRLETQERAIRHNEDRIEEMGERFLSHAERISALEHRRH